MVGGTVGMCVHVWSVDGRYVCACVVGGTVGMCVRAWSVQL